MRATALILAALAAIGAMVANAGFPTISYTVTIDSLAMDVGDEGSVELRISDIEGDLGAWTIDAMYNPEIVSVVACEPMTNSACDPDQEPAVLRVQGAAANPLREDTTLATATFRCQGEGTSPLLLTFEYFGIEVDLDVELEDGSIICQILLGDVDGDDAVNSIDAFHLLQAHAAIIPLPLPAGWHERGDVNHDGVLGPADALLILQYHARLIDSL